MEGLLQYLYNGDVLGFIRAVFTYSFGSADAFFAVITLAITVPIYIRTRSLILLSILWILTGGVFQALSPSLNIFAVFFLVMGIGGLIYQLFMSD